ncbi:MAG: hypothetical protein A2622_13990 [Bdellovibrionales bacterium RIFCSPHIGHO2_01_FULL_40_29]|nr:MAG: hypothetical protein A2622_13990 [Bdellovibrionales bacterium RIFCSPHIGHO2_01_FULL_40_29]OFZ33631.1 MAG: hypothetical protein A3D17_11600 [Bdellovibrionales bacterium RIFCSPHIGHO2_02_FULL_40_15]
MKLLAFLLFISFANLISSTSQAQTLSIAMDENFPPYCYINESGKPAGIYVELLSQMLETNGIKFQFRPLPWARLVSETDQNTVDISIPWRATPERFEKYKMLGPFTHGAGDYYFFAKKTSKATWNSLIDLKGKSIGVVRGFSYPKEFDETTVLTKEAKNDTTTLVKMLVGGRLDFAFSDEIVFKAEMEKQNIQSQIIKVGRPLAGTDRYFVVPKEKSELANKLSKMFELFSKTPEYDRIVRRYISK